MKNNIENISQPSEEKLNIKNEISYYLFFWPWFLLTILMGIIVSYTYLRYTPNIYKSNAQIQITKSDASSSFLTTEVTSLFGTRVNIDNDISVITSHFILKKVVKQLNLQTTITEVGRVKSSLKYGEEIPFKIIFKDLNNYQNWNLIFYDDYGEISNGLKTFEINKNEIHENKYFKFTINDSVLIKNKEYSVVFNLIDNSASILKNRIIASPASKNTEIINLSIAGTNKKRNDAILLSLIHI